MNLVVIGTGYVGLVAGACFSEMGNNVVCIDNNANKIDSLRKGIIPIYEPGLESLVLSNLKKATLSFEYSLDSITENFSVIIVAVGTPMKPNGAAELKNVFDVAKKIGEVITNDVIVINKSTVPVGTCKKIKEIIQKELENRNKNIDVQVISNPEFLKEGSAINDFMKPDRVIIGSNTQKGFEVMKILYSPFFRTHNRYLEMDVASAEMTKYAANAMLATKISFINEIANICEKVGADINQVRLGIGSDKRIGYDFIYAGVGYGGTCFPKDISALRNIASKNNYQPHLLESVIEVNEKQKNLFFNKILNHFKESVKGLTFGVWGLAFKPETDDVREAPSLYIIERLIERGAFVKVYDPEAMNNTKEYFKGHQNSITYCNSKYEAIEQVDALILVTEWKEFRSPNFLEMSDKMNNKVIFDGRNQYTDINIKEKGFKYYQIGKG
jgi:UDPglucose 6-dehydrogenase